MAAQPRSWPGFFITLEGGEGAGKSTQAKRLAAALSERGIKAVETREPGGSPAAERIRAVILDASLGLDAMTQLMLFSAARRDHWLKTILPALLRGAVVLCDRFYDSTNAYQQAAGGLEAAAVEAMRRFAIGDASPDLTLFLDIDPALGLSRARARRAAGPADSFEERDLAFHARIQAAFRASAESEPGRIRRIDASGTADGIASSILAAVAAQMAASGFHI